jgi:hypothetical protein
MMRTTRRQLLTGAASLAVAGAGLPRLGDDQFTKIGDQQPETTRTIIVILPSAIGLNRRHCISVFGPRDVAAICGLLMTNEWRCCRHHP